MSELNDDVQWPPRLITTDRLLLRAPEAADRGGLLDLLSSTEVRRYLGGPIDRQQLEHDAPEVPRSTPGAFFIADSQGFIGLVRFDRRDRTAPGHLRPEGGELELSYMLLPHAWGRGYGLEACTAALGWAADQLPDDDVIVCTQVANQRSRRLAEKLGFVEVDRFRAHDADQWLGSRQLHDL